jgi:hypothetical protein
MNQCADSLKKNLQLIVAKPLINRRGRLLRHTMRCSRSRDFARWHQRPSHSTSPSIGLAGKRRELARTNRVRIVAGPFAADPWPDQVSPGFAGFLDLDGFALAGFRALAGLMLSGLPAAAGAAVASGSGLKNARHTGVNCDLFLIMQAVTRSTSGISAPQAETRPGCRLAPARECRPGARQHRNRERRCKHQTEVEISGPHSKHESPRSDVLRSVGE